MVTIYNGIPRDIINATPKTVELNPSVYWDYPTGAKVTPYINASGKERITALEVLGKRTADHFVVSASMAGHSVEDNTVRMYMLGFGPVAMAARAWLAGSMATIEGIYDATTQSIYLEQYARFKKEFIAEELQDMDSDAVLEHTYQKREVNRGVGSIDLSVIALLKARSSNDSIELPGGVFVDFQEAKNPGRGDAFIVTFNLAVASNRAPVVTKLVHRVNKVNSTVSMTIDCDAEGVRIDSPYVGYSAKFDKLALKAVIDLKNFLYSEAVARRLPMEQYAQAQSISTDVVLSKLAELMAIRVQNKTHDWKNHCINTVKTYSVNLNHLVGVPVEKFEEGKHFGLYPKVTMEVYKGDDDKFNILNFDISVISRFNSNTDFHSSAVKYLTLNKKDLYSVAQLPFAMNKLANSADVAYPSTLNEFEEIHKNSTKAAGFMLLNLDWCAVLAGKLDTRLSLENRIKVAVDSDISESSVDSSEPFNYDFGFTDLDLSRLEVVPQAPAKTPEEKAAEDVAFSAASHIAMNAAHAVNHNRSPLDYGDGVWNPNAVETPEITRDTPETD